MARSFYPVDRDQADLFPQALSEMVSEDNVCRLITEVVEQLDCSALVAKYADGKGQKAYHPRMMLSLLLLSYCLGIRSSRKIEAVCQYDLRFRVITNSCFPDHSSIARFRQSIRESLKALFVSTLELCREAGLGKLGVVSIDGTKIKANAAMDANRTRADLAAQVELILNEAEETDAREDAEAPLKPADEQLPENLRSKASRAAAFRAAKDRQQRLHRAHEEADRKARQKIQDYDETVGRRQAKEHETGNKACGRVPQPPSDDDINKTKANTTDPDSQLMKSAHGFVQGYNAQVAVSQDGLVLAADVVTVGCDQNQLPPMIQQVQDNLANTGGGSVEEYLGDAGYWSPPDLAQAYELLQSVDQDHRPQLMVAQPPILQRLSPQQLEQPLAPDATLLHRLEQRQRCQAGQQIYRNRGSTAEPTFGQIKSARGCRRFMQRGHANAQAEWDLICLTHNLLKLHRRQMAERN